VVADSCRLVEKHKDEGVGRLNDRRISFIVAIGWFGLSCLTARLHMDYDNELSSSTEYSHY
jgi:hypothetical protein